MEIGGLLSWLSISQIKYFPQKEKLKKSKLRGSFFRKITDVIEIGEMGFEN